MSYEQIQYEEQDDVRIIRFDRPEVMNCIGPLTHRELCDAWGRFRADEGAKVAIITGAGPDAFCAGGDLRDPPVSADEAEIEAHRRGDRPGFIGPSRWTDIYKPIIAAVNGVAYAGGLEWACFADIRIAEEHASFGVTCRRWNVGLGDGGTQRLPRIIGMGRALELILTGRVIDAHEAERIGLVNRVVPRGESLDAALELARGLCELPQSAMRTDKEAALRGFGLPLDQGLTIEAQCFYRSIFNPETTEGLRRFRERDHPDRHPGGSPVTPGLVKRLDE
ncbi:MAG: enoyl-CoA hydratase/isomerase family protein [Deltaproteobacteria bacterium]|nr:enoyl-CoA hydratase/isomerase family protein [Deltaproteobacteria bacterium]MBW2530013.1 enoyl-CoA hydratase/isomerase family protein [Deltaproteobacteria bacterium]